MNARFGISTLFVGTFLVAIGIIVVQDLLDDSMFWLSASTLLLVLSDNCFTRLRNQLTVFQSGLRAVIRGMFWSGTCVAVALTIESGWLFGCFGFLLGASIGFTLSIAPVSLIALIPGQKLQYLGERNSPTDKTVSSITPYIGGQGG